MSKIFAYCRVSTGEQDTGLQEKAIKDRYPDAVVRSEKATGKRADSQTRPMLNLLLEMLSEGDKLVVWKLDRLARSLEDLSALVSTIEGKGAALEILDSHIDTKTASGKAFLGMLGVFAEFETNLRRERQLAGIAKAKQEGRHLGRPKKVDEQKVKELSRKGMSATEIAKELNIGRASVYRALDALDQQGHGIFG